MRPSYNLGALHLGEVSAYLDRMHRTEDIAPEAMEAFERVQGNPVIAELPNDEAR